VIVVIGGGVAGLAAARALAAHGGPYLVLEREAEPGGLCRSIRAGGYTFDMSGHFLHTSDPAMRKRVLALPGVAWGTVNRDAGVWLRGRLTPYPFQVHLAGHDPAFVRRCLRDFARERVREAAGGEPDAPKHFAEWLERRFGRAMCRAFFFPYNRKMWRVPLEEMGYEWTDWSVPVPRFEDLLAGARGELCFGMGYNPSFLYPRRGGMGAFVRALAGPVTDRLRTGVGVERLDLRRREIRTDRKSVV
jgi:protoporphyrinogen oxidase